MQLVAYGAQDIYLTGNPQITFFKVVYRRHTNFSMETIQQTLNGASAIAATAGSSTVTISRNGDLVSGVYVRCDQGTTSTAGTTAARNAAELITDVELEIGGQRIDKHTNEWLKMWAELTTPDSKSAAYKYMTGGFSNSFSTCSAVGVVTGAGAALGGHAQESLQVPLQFWFCRNPGLALPLIALQYHEVKLKFNWGLSTIVSRRRSFDSSSTATPTIEVWADYIYLDTDERRRFAQVSHEYLIEQLQYQDENADNTTFKLNFNHPVKEILWTDDDSGTAWGEQKCRLQLNGHDRFSEQSREYFQLRQPFEHHTAIPGFNVKEMEKPQMITPVETGIKTHAAAAGSTAAILTATTLTIDDAHEGPTASRIEGGFRVGDILLISLGGHNNAAEGSGGTEDRDMTYHHMVTIESRAGNVLTFNTDDIDTVPFNALEADDGLSVRVIGRLQDPQSRCSSLAKHINCYSFALKPEEHQPSGTCNFSRIDNAQMIFSATCNVDTIYAVNYNVLRIMSGMGGLAYSN